MELKLDFSKALVTGGAGFIGSHIVEELLKQGIRVVSVDNLLSGKLENVQSFQDNPDFKFVCCDITNYKDLVPLFEDVDIVFHNAASKKTICLNDPRRDLDINAKGTFNLLELSIDNGVEKFVHASTGSVYGEGIILPQNEGHPLVPSSYYGVSKLAGEKYVKVFNTLYGLNTTVLRYFHVYGPKQDFSKVGGVVSIFIDKIMKNRPITIFGDGNQQRSFTYVKDVVRANILVANNSKTDGEVYNCASGINFTIKKLAETLFKIMGRKVPIKYENWISGDIKIFNIDNSKLKSLDFRFETPFEQGLKETIEWMRRHNKCLKKSLLQ